jgi:P27 family predicted phage terminase small subunit
MRVMTAGDEDGLAMGCQALVEYLTASRKMDRLGQTYTIDGPSGEIIRKRPECEIAADAWRRYMTALGQFGLTPSARMKVSQAGGGKQVRDEWDEF